MMAGGPIRVLLVDDSATVRAVLRRVFARQFGLEVVGEASDGQAGVDAAVRLKPDVVLMDIEMPLLDGYAATERIMALRPTPILVLSSRANRDQVRTAFEALRRGAVEVLPKPEDPSRWQELAALLPGVVRAVARRPAGTPGKPAGAAPTTGEALPDVGTRRAIRYVAVGASTGGPEAIHRFLGALPARTPAVTLIVQHIAPGFEDGFAEWLGRELGRDVQVAVDDERPQPGAVRLAPSGAHLLLEQGGVLRVDRLRPPRAGHRPSVDELFLSCAAAVAHQASGILLTGMGSDGAEGLVTLRRAGALTMVQDEASSVVFGMPRAALDRGAAEIALPPHLLAAVLVRAWGGDPA